MRIISITVIIVFLLSISSYSASKEIIEGNMQSYGCILKKTPCPKDEHDPITSFVKRYVLVTKENLYYFVPNLKKSFLARYINQRIRITGTVGQHYPSICAIKIEIFKKGTWITTWSMGGGSCPLEAFMYKDSNSIVSCKEYLYNKNLDEFQFHGKDLSNANLSRASLVRTDLSESKLFFAYLGGANLYRANLSMADLSGADLSECNLKEANLVKANLREADLSGAKNLTIEQLSKVKTLFKAKLDPELMVQVKEKYPHLLEKPKDEE